MKRLFALLFITALFSACESNLDPNNALDEDLIMAESFENEDNQPTYEDWTVKPNLTSFATDVPKEGGSWSLQLEPGWAPEEGFAEQYIDVSTGTDIYTLSAWVKGKGYILMGVWSGDELINSKKITNESKEWKHISIMDTFTIQPGDRLYVKLSAGMTEVGTWKTLVDLLVVEKFSIEG